MKGVRDGGLALAVLGLVLWAAPAGATDSHFFFPSIGSGNKMDTELVDTDQHRQKMLVCSTAVADCAETATSTPSASAKGLVVRPVGGFGATDDRPSGGGTPTTLNTLNQVVPLALGGYQSGAFTFSSSTLSGATIKPACSYGDPTDTATYIVSADFKFSDTTDEDDVATELTADFDRTYTISCGATSPTGMGVKLTAVTSGAVSVLGRVKMVQAFLHPWPEYVDKTLKGHNVVTKNKTEIAGQDAASSISSFTLCTGQFNLLLDTDTNATLHVNSPDPAAGLFTRICRVKVVIQGATGSANILLVQGTDANCGTGKATVAGPWRVSATGDGTPGWSEGGGMGWIYRATDAAKRLCWETDSATATRVDGTFAVH